MNTIKHIYILLLVTLVSACSKTMELDTLDFDASLPESTVTAGEEVIFNLKGNANIITFYSGELGKEYQFREGRPLELSEPIVSFSSDAWFGTQKNQMSILVSTEFNGDYTSENIKTSFEAGEWVDITTFLNVPDNTGTRQTVPSGPFDLSGIITPEKKPIYFAFRNQVKPDAIADPVTQWTMTRFLLTVNTLLGRQTLVDHASAGWQYIMAKDQTVQFPLVQATNVFFRRSTDRTLTLDNWVITKKIEFEPISLGVDIGEPIKSYADPQLTELKHTFDVPGTYIATFLASNVNAEGEKKVVKQIKVVVEP